MRSSSWIVGAAALLFATAGAAESYFAFNAVDFTVPVDELDATGVGAAAVHSGFLPLSESDPRLQAARNAADQAYEIWELPSHKVATITLAKIAKTGRFVVTFVAKDPSQRRGESLRGEACKRWLRFSAALRIEFAGPQQRKFRFRFPQCDP